MVAWEQAIATLAQKLTDAARAPDGPTVVRVETPIDACNPFAWLAAQASYPKLYWANRDGAFITAALGAAHCITAQTAPDYDRLFDTFSADCAPAHPGMRYYGGIAFEPTVTPQTPWESFGTYYFMLPRFELRCENGQWHAACNVCIDTSFEETIAWLKTLRSSSRDSIGPLPRCLTRQDCPTREQWEPLVQDTLQAIQRGELDKVVLARRSAFAFTDAIEPFALLQQLNECAHAAYVFGLQPAPGLAFLGATPETLYQRQSAHVICEALAGTQPRGASPEQDQAMIHALTGSDKEQREHRMVVDGIQRVLGAICQVPPSCDTVSVTTLRNCHHLRCRLEGELKSDCRDAALIRALHPTAAVGGHPTATALTWLRRFEPFKRHWYAGPVGWVGHDAAEFAVAIRSGLVDGNRLSLFAGAGIVEGSGAGNEWNELEQKIGNFLHAIRL